LFEPTKFKKRQKRFPKAGKSCVFNLEESGRGATRLAVSAGS